MSEQRAAVDEPGTALLSLYDLTLPQVYGYLLQRCGRTNVAEDLTAETFLAAVDAVRRQPPVNVSAPWLIGVARHKLVDHWRRQARDERRLSSLVNDELGPADPWDAHIDGVRARETLAQLAPHHSSVLVLRYFDDLPVAEVAALLDRTVHATEGLLARARAAFRRAYTAEDGAFDD